MWFFERLVVCLFRYFFLLYYFLSSSIFLFILYFFPLFFSLCFFLFCSFLSFFPFVLLFFFFLLKPSIFPRAVELCLAAVVQHLPRHLLKFLLPHLSNIYYDSCSNLCRDTCAALYYYTQAWNLPLLLDYLQSVVWFYTDYTAVFFLCLFSAFVYIIVAAGTWLASIFAEWQNGRVNNRS